MLIKNKLFRLIASSFLIMSLCLLTFADTVRLKDGSIVKGRVIGFKDGQFVVVIGEGSRQRQMNFYSDEIESIEFDSKNLIQTTTVSQNNNPVNQPRPTPTPVSSDNPSSSNPNVRVVGTQPPTNTQSGDSNSRPENPRTSGVQINAKVLADNTSNGWTNTGWVVKKGQRIRISGTGRVSLGNGRYATPSGVSSLPDTEKLLKEKPTGALIAVIGDDNNDFIFVGGSNEFIANRDGALFLGINEGYLDDNSGAFDVVIEIDPMNNSGS